MDAGIGVGGMSTGKDELASSCFDLFSYPEVETGVKKSFLQTFRPISSTTSKGPFTFDIPADPEKFTDAESLRLHGAMRIVKDTAGVYSSLAAGENVSTVNNIFNSLWSSVNTQLNGTEITDPSSRWYAYKSYFENNLSYSNSSKENILSSRGYFKDTPEKFDDVGTGSNASANTGFNDRKKLFEESKWENKLLIVFIFLILAVINLSVLLH